MISLKELFGVKMKCIYCNGEVKPTAELFKKENEERFKLMMKKLEITSEEKLNYNCVDCGQAYSPKGAVLKYKVNWLK